MKPTILLTVMILALGLLSGCSRFNMSDPDDASYISDSDPSFASNGGDNPSPYRQDNAYQQMSSNDPRYYSDPNASYGYDPTDPAFTSSHSSGSGRSQAMASSSGGGTSEVPFSMSRKRDSMPNYGALD